MSALAFEGVACARGGRVLFEALSFDLRGGDALLVTGANGAGKSSLLRVAAGLLAPVAGRVVAEGRIALADERLGMDGDVPLAAALGFWAQLDGGDVGGALAATGLAHLAEVPLRLFSTGQRKRAVLARTIAARAGIWLLDEPANGLDSDGAAMLARVIAAHRAGGGIAVVASHQPVELPDCQQLNLPPFVPSPSATLGTGVEGLSHAAPGASTSLGMNGS